MERYEERQKLGKQGMTSVVYLARDRWNSGRQVILKSYWAGQHPARREILLHHRLRCAIDRVSDEEVDGGDASLKEVRSEDGNENGKGGGEESKEKKDEDEKKGDRRSKGKKKGHRTSKAGRTGLRRKEERYKQSDGNEENEPEEDEGGQRDHATHRTPHADRNGRSVKDNRVVDAPLVKSPKLRAVIDEANLAILVAHSDTSKTNHNNSDSDTSNNNINNNNNNNTNGSKNSNNSLCRGSWPRMRGIGPAFEHKGRLYLPYAFHEGFTRLATVHSFLNGTFSSEGLVGYGGRQLTKKEIAEKKKQHQELGLLVVAELALAVLYELQGLHELGFTHNDLHMDNVLVKVEGLDKTEQVKMVGKMEKGKKKTQDKKKIQRTRNEKRKGKKKHARGRRKQVESDGESSSSERMRTKRKGKQVESRGETQSSESEGDSTDSSAEEHSDDEDTKKPRRKVRNQTRNHNKKKQNPIYKKETNDKENENAKKKNDKVIYPVIPDDAGLDWRVAIIDFGSAAPINTKANIPGHPAMMSPEQAFHRRLTPSSDIFFVGSLVHYLLTKSVPLSPIHSAGKAFATFANPVLLVAEPGIALAQSERPWGSCLTEAQMERLECRLNEGYVAKREGLKLRRRTRQARVLGRAMGMIVHRALASKAETRYQSCEEMIRDLELAIARSRPTPEDQDEAETDCRHRDETDDEEDEGEGDEHEHGMSDGLTCSAARDCDEARRKESWSGAGGNDGCKLGSSSGSSGGTSSHVMEMMTENPEPNFKLIAHLPASSSNNNNYNNDDKDDNGKSNETTATTTTIPTYIGVEGESQRLVPVDSKENAAVFKLHRVKSKDNRIANYVTCNGRYLRQPLTRLCCDAEKPVFGTKFLFHPMLVDINVDVDVDNETSKDGNENSSRDSVTSGSKSRRFSGIGEEESRWVLISVTHKKFASAIPGKRHSDRRVRHFALQRSQRKAVPFQLEIIEPTTSKSKSKSKAQSQSTSNSDRSSS